MMVTIRPPPDPDPSIKYFSFIVEIGGLGIKIPLSSMTNSRKREKTPRKSVAEEALSVAQQQGYGVMDLSVNDLVDKAVEIQKASGTGNQVGRSSIKKAVKSAIEDLQKSTPAKQDFVGDDDAIVLSSRVKDKK